MNRWLLQSFIGISLFLALAPGCRDRKSSDPPGKVTATQIKIQQAQSAPAATPASTQGGTAAPPSTNPPPTPLQPAPLQPKVQAQPGKFVTLNNKLPGGRVDHTATLLQNGTLLIAGGYDGQDATGTLIIHDPKTDGFTDTGLKMSAPRVLHTATRVSGPDKVLDTADDVVVIIGGLDTKTDSTVAAIDIFDPDRNNDGVANDPELIKSPVGLGDVGQIPAGPSQTKVDLSFYLHTASSLPMANKVSQTASANEIFVIGGEFVYQGMGGFVGNLQMLAVEVDPNGDGDYADTEVTDTVSAPIFNRINHSATVLAGPDKLLHTADDLLLIYGGDGEDRNARPTSTQNSKGATYITLGSAEIFDLKAGSWHLVNDHHFYPDSPQVTATNVGPSPRKGHSATRIVAAGAEAVLFMGGTDEEANLDDPNNPGKPYPGDNNPQIAEALVINYQKLADSKILPVGLLGAHATDHAAVRLHDGRVLAAGGLDLKAGAPATAAEIFDTAKLGGRSNPLAATGVLGTARIRPTLSALPGADGKLDTSDDRYLAVGGISGSNPQSPTILDTAEVYAP